ncbi:MAG: restriction endonuclease subunit S [Anaerolineales bacterium]|nr:restriction endonuclease subunit S [Anaerolineales bacterium]
MRAQLKRIAECAEVLPGYALKARAEHEPEGTYQVMMAKHIPDCRPYRYIDEHELRMTPAGSPENYRVQKGDVLFISRGVRNCAAVIESVPEKTIASATFYILRVYPTVDPSYLAWCLNQPPIQAQIGQIRTGAGTPIVQRNALGDVQIPVPPLEEQKRLVELGALMAEELRLRKRLVEATEAYHRVLGQQLITELNQD